MFKSIDDLIISQDSNTINRLLNTYFNDLDTLYYVFYGQDKLLTKTHILKQNLDIKDYKILYEFYLKYFIYNYIKLNIKPDTEVELINIDKPFQNIPGEYFVILIN